MGRPRQMLEWGVAMFGPIARNRDERVARFIEEAIELAHAEGMSTVFLDRLIARVYSRPKGISEQEIGQCQVTLELLAESIGISSDNEAAIEWARIRSIPKTEWQRRQNAKSDLGIAGRAE